MAARQLTGDMSLFSLGGSSYLGLFRNVKLAGTFDTVESRPAVNLASRAQVVKKGGVLSTELMSVVSGSAKVSHLDLSVFTLDGSSWLGAISGKFSGSFEHKEADGPGTIWKYPLVVSKDYEFSGTIKVPATGGIQAMMVDAWSATAADNEWVVTFTVNGVAITLPMVLTSAEVVFEEAGIQTVAITMKGQGPDNTATAYPTAPTGTTSILEKAFNAPKTAIAWALTSHATEGLAYSGNAVIQSFEIGIEDGALINIAYAYATQGAVTATAN